MALMLSSWPLQGQPMEALAGRSMRAAETSEAPVGLPKTADEINAAISRIDGRLAEVRLKISTPTAHEKPAVTAFSVTPEELAEREQLLQQWVIALDQQGRHLRHLTEIRRLNREHAAEEEAWRGFGQAPTIAVAEQLSDAVSAERLQQRTTQLLLAILESEISRSSARLAESHKQLRLAVDFDERAGGPDSLRHWRIQLARFRNAAWEASVESAEIGRLVTWEALDGQRKHLGFLERKLAEARSQARITKSDLDSLIVRINEKRALFQKELNEAIAADHEVRAARDAAAEKARAARSDLAAESQAQVEQVRVETSTRRIETLRGFLQLADYARAVWEDRLWVTEKHSLAQLRAKKRHYSEILEGLRQWKALMEQSLSGVSDQVLRQTLRADDGRLPEIERGTAKQLQAAFQERAWVELRAVGALVFTEELTARLHAELDAQVAGISLAGKLHSVMEEISTFLSRMWNMELYIAEDSVIAGGHKVSIPRSITFGKVVIALCIFAAGLWVASWAYRLARRVQSRWMAREPHTADVSAKFIAGVIALISLIVAMASVRIPWTVFAFMGGALAIGVGFGAQALIKNFISGVILLCERSIRVGDIVEVDDHRGKLVRVGFRNSLLTRGDGIDVLLPNSQFLEKEVVNWTLRSDLVRYSISVGVAYGSPLAKAAELILQAAAEHPHVGKEPAPDVLLEEFGDNALVFNLQFWMHLGAGADGGRVRSELRHRICALFDEAGISIAYPQRDIHLDARQPLEIKLVDSPAHPDSGSPRLRPVHPVPAIHAGTINRRTTVPSAC